MAKIKKKYSFTNGREIWRLIPSQSDKLIIEERDLVKKEAFYNCVEIDTGKKIFSDFQLDEKFWSGIEAVEDDIIFFHKYIKPDMPMHKGVIAVDTHSQKIRWMNDDYNFLFSGDGIIYCYKPLFDGRNYFTVDMNSGEILENLGSDHRLINSLKEKFDKSAISSSYSFPETYSQNSLIDSKTERILKGLRNGYVVVGKVDYLVINSLLLFSFHEADGNNQLKNKFMAVDIESGKNIFQETLNKGIRSFIPDSFFLIRNVLFLLKNKNEVIVCSIK